jgi:hypothetical protein
MKLAKHRDPKLLVPTPREKVMLLTRVLYEKKTLQQVFNYITDRLAMNYKSTCTGVRGFGLNTYPNIINQKNYIKNLILSGRPLVLGC